MILPLIALSLIRPALDDPIDFPTTVATAPQIVKVLADKSGLTMRCSQNVANDVVGVSPQKNTARQIMDQLAYAIQAEWKQEGGVWMLGRPEATVKAQEAKAQMLLAEAIQKSLDKLPKDAVIQESDAKSLAQQADTFQKQNQGDNRVLGDAYTQLQNKMPAYRLLTRFLRRLGSSSLATIPSGGRYVYAAQPNTMQKRFPNGFDADVAQFVKENNLVAEAWLPSTPEEGRIWFEAPKAAKGPIKVLVSISGPSLDNMNASVTAYDSKGRQVAQAQNYAIYRELDESMMAPVKAKPDETLIELTPLSKQLLDFARMSMTGRQPNAPSDIRVFLSHPKDREPLSIVNQEAVGAIAKSEGKPTIVPIPELQLFASLMLAQDGKLTVNRYTTSLERTGLTREEHDGWICYRETNPAHGRIQRVDRLALDGYYRRIERDKRSSLDGFAEFVLKYPGRLESTLFPMYLVLSGSYPSNWQYNEDLNMVRFYGLLTPEQKTAFRKGAKLTIENFSNQERTILSQVVYCSRAHSFGMSSDDAPAPAAAVDEDTNPYQSIATEPTEQFPNGLAAPFEVSADVKDSDSWFRRELWGDIRPTDANNIAWDLMQTERPDLFPWAAQYANQRGDGEYVKGHANQWTFKLRTTPVMHINVELTDHDIPEGPFLKYGGLPEDFKKEVGQRLAEMREQYKNMKPGEFGGPARGTPPPKR